MAREWPGQNRARRDSNSRLGKDELMIKTLAGAIAASSYILFAMQPAGAAPAIKHVFVIVMENTDAQQIYGKKDRAPYINNSLIPNYARGVNFRNPLPHLDSEPHYIWMEAGTNKFGEQEFTTDDDPSPSNSTATKDHLVTQIEKSGTVTWMTYQEDIKTGQCPIRSSPPYAAKHNPFVFFQDVSGNPPRKDNEFCKMHTSSYDVFAADLAANRMANYVFITPNLCHDMHGHKKCPKVDRVKAGDKWLSAELPRIIDWVGKNSGVIFILWDEGASKQSKIPFLAIGPGIKAGYASDVEYDHGSLVRSVEEIFDLPILPTVAGNNSFVDMFKPSSFP
jgi:phosphatidylinositol-3-phosphatase